MKWFLYLIARADVILAPHNLAAFLFECAVMVPGQLTASWTLWAEAFCINFTLKMPYQSCNSTCIGKLERLLFPVVCWKTLSQTSAAVSSYTDVNWHTQRWTDLVSAVGIFPNLFLSATDDPNTEQPWLKQFCTYVLFYQLLKYTII